MVADGIRIGCGAIVCVDFLGRWDSRRRKGHRPIDHRVDFLGCQRRECREDQRLGSLGRQLARRDLLDDLK